MITINGIKIIGVPIGTKWQNIWFILLIQPYNINDIHKGKARLAVKTKWLDLVNT